MATTSLEGSPYLDVVRQPLESHRCALLVIDIQENLLPPIYEKERLIRNSQLLVRLANILSLPVIATTQYIKGLGQVVPEIASLLPAVTPVDKLEFGCFGNGEFCSNLARLHDRDVLLLRNGDAHLCAANGLGSIGPGPDRTRSC